MDIRGGLKRPVVATTVGVLAALLIIMCVVYMGGGLKRTPVIGGVVDGRYYTSDEGQTWAADHWDLATPFEKDGKTFLRVGVFTYDDKTGFPVYLEKLSPQARAEISAAPPGGQRYLLEQREQDSLLVKRIGASDAEWVSKYSGEGQLVIAPPTDPVQGTARQMIPDLAKK